MLSYVSVPDAAVHAQPERDSGGWFSFPAVVNGERTKIWVSENAIEDLLKLPGDEDHDYLEALRLNLSEFEKFIPKAIVTLNRVEITSEVVQP